MILKQKKMVLIDDAPSILMFLRTSLEALGAQCHEAQTASGGLALAEHVNPDLVILDLGLPDREGFSIMHKLKHMTTNNKPKIIILTVRNDRESLEKATELGADAYITKPFRMQDILQVICDNLNIPLARSSMISSTH